MTTGYISGIFGASPVRPIQKHCKKATQCALQLTPFFQGVISGDWDRCREVRQEIIRLENQADDLKQEFRLNLPKSLFMPVSRSDLLELISMQDRVANKAKDISGLVIGREMSIPEGLAKPYVKFLKRSLDAVKQARKTVNELDELFVSGFKGREVDLVIEMTEKLSRIEHDADEMQIGVRARLFELEKDMPPIDTMFLYKIIDWTGDLGDLAQRVGSRLHLVIAR